MGMYGDVTAVSEQEFDKLSQEIFDGSWSTQTATANSVSLEKAWHGLHYLLTGDAWSGQGPLAFLLSGGQGSDDEDAPRWFAPEETRKIHQALASVSDDALWSRFDASKMEQLGIYPLIWDEEEEELREEYLMYFHDLKQVVQVATESGLGLMISIG